MKQNYVISLEIGSSATHIGAASFDADLGFDAPVTVLAIEEEPLNNCVRYGRIQNVEDVTRHTMLALDRLSGRTGVYPRQITGVYTAIGGRSLASCKADAELILPEECEITNEIIEQLKDKATAQVPQNRIALDVIPLRFTVDDIETKRPVGSFGTKIKAQFTVVFCDPLNERNLERVIAERLNLDICGYVVRPIAIAKLSLSSEETRPGCMLVDLGAETTTIAIFKNDALQYVSTIPLGSQNITRDLSAGLGVIEEQAEQIKIRLGNAISDKNSLTSEQIEIDNYVQARVTEIIANIIAHIGFAGFKSTDLCSGIIITGRGAKLRNFCQLLQSQSGLPVRVASISSDLHVADPAINPSDNIALIAVAKEAMLRSLNQNAVPCIVEPEPEPQPLPEPEPETPAQPAQPAAPFTSEQPTATQPEPQNPFNPYNYSGASFGNYSNQELDNPVDEPQPEQPQPDAQDQSQIDDKTLLLDHDKEAEIKEAIRKEQQERQLEALKEAENKRVRNNRPKFLSIIGDKIKSLIDDTNDDSDGYDFDNENNL